MPTESEHKLDALLRAVAKKRSEDAGPDRDLHPAARRLLLAEVARRFPKRERERIPWRLVMGRFWSRTVSAVGLCAFVLVVGWAALKFWGNVSRVDDMAMNEINPPEEINFSLRKRPVQEKESSAPVISTNSFSPLPGRLAKTPPLATAKPTGMVLAAGARIDSTSPFKDTDEMPVGVLRRSTPATTGGARPSRSEPAQETRNAFGIAGARRDSGTFNPTLAPVFATGGVAAFTESLARKPLSGAVAEKTVATPVPATRTEVALLAETSKASPALTRSPLVSAPVAPVVNSPEPAPTSLASDRPKTVSAAASTALRASPPVTSGPASSLFFAQVPANDSRGVLALDSAGSTSRAATKEQTLVLANSTRRKTAAPVLTSFEFKRNGSKVTLIDTDGSVYAGEILGGIEPTLARSLNRETGPAGSARTADFLSAIEGGKAAYSFRVTGTNRTLNEPITLSGRVKNFLDDADRNKGPGRPASAALSQASKVDPFSPAPAPVKSPQTYVVATNQFLLQGTLRIGTNAEQAIQATTQPR